MLNFSSVKVQCRHGMGLRPYRANTGPTMKYNNVCCFTLMLNGIVGTVLLANNPVNVL